MERIEPMYEIVGESGTQDGEGCLREIAVVGAAIGGLILGLGLLAAWIGSMG